MNRKSPNQRRRNIVSIRLTDEELKSVKQMAEDMGITMAELWRSFRLTVQVLFSSDLSLSDALQINDDTIEIHKLLATEKDPPLHKAIRPIPELMDIIRAKETLSKVEEERRKSTNL